jgi:hypothetical protein
LIVGYTGAQPSSRLIRALEARRFVFDIIAT